jgi:hypothetical protein
MRKGRRVSTNPGFEGDSTAEQRSEIRRQFIVSLRLCACPSAFFEMLVVDFVR